MRVNLYLATGVMTWDTNANSHHNNVCLYVPVNRSAFEWEEWSECQAKDSSTGVRTRQRFVLRPDEQESEKCVRRSVGKI